MESRPDIRCRIVMYMMGLEVDHKVLIAGKNIADRRDRAIATE